ncbi:SIS domain-containing protein [Candidatus Bathyarchaeota archaeon]|nr:SIS domain-containing protein [Candidatus Bathyarchaeota archaeon]
MSLREEKQEYDMIRDIRETPAALRSITRALNRMNELADLAHKFKKIFFIGCGSSYYAALFGSWPLAKSSKVLAYALPSSELIFHFADIIDSNSLVVGISRSGRTAETIAALNICRKKGAYIIGFSIEEESSMLDVVDDLVVLDIGGERSIIMTKSFSTLSLATSVFSSILNERVFKEKQPLIEESKVMPSLAERLLKNESMVADISKRLIDENIERFIFLGSGPSYPIVLEGALKVKETSYVATEGLHLLEFRHGPMAMVGEKFSLVISCFLNENNVHLKNFISEFANKNVDMILITDTAFNGPKETVIEMPIEYSGECKALLSIIPMQILAYYYAVGKGRNPDKPRNLSRYVQRF